MSVFTRLALLYLILVAGSIILVLNIFYNDIKLSMHQTSEETLVDSANLVAELLAPYLIDEPINIVEIEKISKLFKQRQLNAKIWSDLKLTTNLDFYITDVKGQVLFHSYDKAQQGKDYSAWLDVSRTINGEYGARTTLTSLDNDLSGSMYVAAPIRLKNRLIGVLTLIQTHHSIQQFVAPAQTKILLVGLVLLLSIMCLGLLLIRWFNNTLAKLTTYVNKIRRGEPVRQLKLNDSGFNKLSETLHEMRQDLDGKAYIEQYVQTLTHELKTPLSSISAAAQILETDVDDAQKQKFLSNIETEVERLKQLVERLLVLASIENQQHKEFKRIDMAGLIQDEIDSFQALLIAKNISTVFKKPNNVEAIVYGDEFLLRMAIRNLLDNAIDFSFNNVTLEIFLENTQTNINFRLINQGQSIPEYAVARLFERFFSTHRLSTGRKSSGLGLCLVNGIAQLHAGAVSLNNTLVSQANGSLVPAVEAVFIIAKGASTKREPFNS